MISRIFLTDIDKFLHHSRRPAVLFPGKKNPGRKLLFFDDPDGKICTEVFHGSWKNGSGKAFLHPEHGISGIVADTENIRLEIFFSKGFHQKFFVPPVNNERASGQLFKADALFFCLIFRDLRRRRDLRPCRRAGTAGVAVLFLALLCKASVAHPVSVPKEKIKQVRKAQYCNREMDFRCIVMKSFPYCGTVPFFVRESKILKRVEWFCTGVGGFYLKKGVY